MIKHILYTLVILVYQMTFSLDDLIKTEELYSFKGTFLDGEPMGIPMMVASFSDGAFVLYEYELQALKKFDNNGKFLKNLTRRGRGPGELLKIDHIYIDNKDRLLITDHVQLKITVIGTDNEFADHFIFENRPTIRSLHQTYEGHYIFGFVNYSQTLLQTNPKMFYLVCENFKIHTPGFVHPKDLHQLVPGSVSEVVMRGTSKRLTENSVMTINDDLLVVPAFYNGKFLLYTKDSDYEDYKIIEVSSDYDSPYEEFHETRQINQQLFDEEGVSMVNNSAGRKLFLHYNRSLGLFKLKTGHIVHFAQIKDGNEAILVAEILDDKGMIVLTTQNLQTLGNLIIKENLTRYRQFSRINLEFLHLDQQNRLFVSKFGENDIPELHVIKLNVDL